MHRTAVTSLHLPRQATFDNGGTVDPWTSEPCVGVKIACVMVHQRFYERVYPCVYVCVFIRLYAFTSRNNTFGSVPFSIFPTLSPPFSLSISLPFLPSLPTLPFTPFTNGTVFPWIVRFLSLFSFFFYRYFIPAFACYPFICDRCLWPIFHPSLCEFLRDFLLLLLCCSKLRTP